MTLGDRVRVARRKLKLSARQLDKAAGLAVGHVALIESGARSRVSVETASCIAGALGVSLDWLVRGQGTGPKAA